MAVLHAVIDFFRPGLRITLCQFVGSFLSVQWVIIVGMKNMTEAKENFS
jgi:hypothetical protein